LFDPLPIRKIGDRRRNVNRLRFKRYLHIAHNVVIPVQRGYIRLRSVLGKSGDPPDLRLVQIVPCKFVKVSDGKGFCACRLLKLRKDRFPAFQQACRVLEAAVNEYSRDKAEFVDLRLRRKQERRSVVHACDPKLVHAFSVPQAI